MPAADSSAAQRAAAACRRVSLGSGLPISTGSAYTVTRTCPGATSSAPKMTRAPSTRSAPTARSAASRLPSPFWSESRKPSRARRGATAAAIAAVSYAFTVRIAARLARELGALGAQVSFDDAGVELGGETGNLIAQVPGTADAPALLLCAHMDTVVPGEGVKPIVEDDVIRTDGRTVLGGDDKSCVALICECVRACREHGLRHPPLDVVFTICEEVGLLGAKHLDLSRVRARRGLVFDSDAVGFVFTRAPGANTLEIVVRGRAAHAGMAPERGAGG